MYEGSSLCGAVAYRLDGDIGKGYFCHCQRCRKASGSAYAANALIAPEAFHITRGEALLSNYHNPETGLIRRFCSQCGSPIVSVRPGTGIMALRLGSLDTPLAQGPGAHIFVASKAQWDHISDDLPCFNERPTA